MGRLKTKEEKSKKLTASKQLQLLDQKVSAAEGMIGQMINVSQELNSRIDSALSFVEALTTRLNSLISVLEEKGLLKEDDVNNKVLEQELVRLKEKVEELKKFGVIAESELGVISHNSYVVVKEFGEDDEVIQERVQFMVSNMSEQIQLALLGKKKGDKVTLGESGNTVEILEVYDVVNSGQQTPEQQESAEESESN